MQPMDTQEFSSFPWSSNSHSYDLEAIGAISEAAAQHPIQSPSQRFETLDQETRDQSLHAMHEFFEEMRGMQFPQHAAPKATRVEPMPGNRFTPYQVRAYHRKDTKEASPEQSESGRIAKMYRERKKVQWAQMQQQLAQQERDLHEARAEIEALRSRLSVAEATIAHMERASPPPTTIPAAASGSMSPTQSDAGANPPYKDSNMLQRSVLAQMQLAAQSPDMSEHDLRTVLGQFRALSLRRNAIAACEIENLLVPEILLKTVLLHPSEADFEETPEREQEELRAWSIIAEKLGATHEQFSKWVVVRQQHRQTFKALMRERMEINAELRKFFLNKIAYHRFLNISQSTANGELVGQAAHLLSRLRANLRCEVRICQEFTEEVDNIYSPRQLVLCSVISNACGILTMSAVDSMRELMLVHERNQDEPTPMEMTLRQLMANPRCEVA